LPNAPSLVHPGRDRDNLLRKRNNLLHKLHEKNEIDSTTFFLALNEQLPGAPRPMPRHVPHLLDRQIIHHRGSFTQTTIDTHLQQLTSYIINRHGRRLMQNEIYNAAAIIASVETGEILAYVGNTIGDETDRGNQVDIILSSRSSGSVLKPFLYASAIQSGVILQNSLLPDIPTYYRSFSPRNYQKRYDGAVPAGQALSRSLNVPFVRLLHEYGGEKFLSTLQNIGFTTMDKPYSHYGLSLILGGSETNLYELTGAYASMARTLNRYVREDGIYSSSDFHPLTTKLSHNPPEEATTFNAPYLKASAIYSTFEAMMGLQRPPEETGWENFSSSRHIAWKTGTSYGFRDAWSIGITPEYVIGVWVGNATGEGRPGIVGGLTAGPILFELFNLLPATSSFEKPYDDMIEIEVCRQSGFRAGQFCTDTDSLFVSNSEHKTPPCPYHHLVHLTPDGRYRTSLHCEPSGIVKTVPFFTLPPLMEWYYKPFNPSYRSLPIFKPGCENPEIENTMEFIYPPPNTTIFIPEGLDGELSRIVLSAVHSNRDAIVHWHINGAYMGSTDMQHEMEFLPSSGRQTVTLIDEEGNRLVRIFNCAGERKVK
jgi:penicillin-binding protein 1C